MEQALHLPTVTAAMASSELTEFERIVAGCQARLHTYTSYLLNDRAEAEDVTQEAFLRLWNHWEKVDIDRVEAWLFRVARNLCVDRFRQSKAKTRATVRIDDQIEPPPDPAPGPARIAASSEMGQHLSSALAALSEPMRSILILREVQGFKYREIAEVLDTPLNTVRVLIHRGRRRVREQLREELHGTS